MQSRDSRIRRDDTFGHMLPDYMPIGSKTKWRWCWHKTEKECETHASRGMG